MSAAMAIQPQMPNSRPALPPTACCRTLWSELRPRAGSKSKPVSDVAARCSRWSKTRSCRAATFLRILRGEKAVTLDDAERVLDASGLASNGALLLAILGHEDLAVEWLGEDAGAFLDQFLAALPVTMNETLEPRIADLRPRWAIGTSRLVARLLAKHIDDFAERDISLVLGR